MSYSWSHFGHESTVRVQCIRKAELSESRGALIQWPLAPSNRSGRAESLFPPLVSLASPFPTLLLSEERVRARATCSQGASGVLSEERSRRSQQLSLFAASSSTSARHSLPLCCLWPVTLAAHRPRRKIQPNPCVLSEYPSPFYSTFYSSNIQLPTAIQYPKQPSTIHLSHR